MRVNIDIPWNRYGLIAELTNRLKYQCPQFGKTILQKMVYLLQEVYGVKCGYQFDLYTYGPFTSQLLQDLDLVETFNAVRISSVMSAVGGYHIEPGERNEELKEKAGEFLRDPVVSKAIDNLIEHFSSSNAKKLELLSTIVYVSRDMRDEGLSRENLIQMVSDVKPKFARPEIEEAVSTLEEKQMVSFP
ncbi:MAG TPA: hypothetical protein ENG83_13270 [Nitrospirae bacterium]|nr:hypothetical protein BMS3Abin06_01806 [bacterium BMS3Abin06]HDH13146.1 hypothetical protein [Nitrospirota bacterium]HDZ03298.1 hypothetical protein [Nitrospirota bacterium]